MRYRYMMIMLLALLATSVFAQQEPVATDEVVLTEEPVSTEEPAETEEIPPTEETQPTEEATPTATEEGDFVLYTVRTGDTLARIANRFGVTVAAIIAANGIANPDLIYVGQVLKIPGVAGEPLPTITPSPIATQIPPATATPRPTVPGETTYIVQRGDTLLKIAQRFNTTTTELMRLNNLTNPNLIYVGQRLIVSGDGTVIPTASPEGETANPESFDYGVAAFMVGEDVTALTTQIDALGMSWVKLDVRWRDLETTQGEIDFTNLDEAISALDAAGIRVLVTITAAPDWARSNLDEDGPPDNFGDFEAFVDALSLHFTGRIEAYQIWNEPNLRREWNSEVYPIRADHYVELLEMAYYAIKANDPNALVIAAGLAPTGFNDGVNALDDRVYLQDMYSNDVMEYSDAVAAHPGGWANPPDAECCAKSNGVESHYESPSFFFKNTLMDYHTIMQRNADERPLWVTKFGWGTSQDTNQPGTDYVYISYTDLAEQAVYAPRAFQIGADLGYVGPMFLDNLNGCISTPTRAERCFYSLIAPDGSSRPVFDAIGAVDKSNGASNNQIPVPVPFDEAAPTP